jgi:hypothetical protein
MSVLLAGGPGSGKSTTSQALRDQGFRSTDLDFGYARWEDLDGSPVQFPAEPGWSWLRSHRWRWRVDLLDAAITDPGDQPVVFAGTASNMFDLLERFDLLLLLQMDGEARQRLVELDAGQRVGYRNPFQFRLAVRRVVQRRRSMLSLWRICGASESDLQTAAV